MGLIRAHNGLFTSVEVIHRNVFLKYLNCKKTFMGSHKIQLKSVQTNITTK